MKRFLPLLAPLFALLVGFVPAPAQEKPAPKHGRGYVPMSPEKKKAIKAAALRRHGNVIGSLLKTVTPPAAFNCADLGIMPPQDDQGSCGSCYLVSSVYVATSAFIKAGWGKNDGSFQLSAQYGLDCKNFGGCGGGDEAEVFDDMKKSGCPAEKWSDLTSGQSFSDYAGYTARSGRCQLKSGAKMWQLKDYGFVAGDGGQGPATVDQYKVAMMTYGPASIALDAGFMDNYNGGVATKLGDSIDHAVKMYAWDDNKDCGDGTKGAVLIKNNWGKSWGVNGDCWVAYHEVKHIVEPIWVLAPTYQPPTPPPPPTPPTPPVPPVPPVPPTPPTPPTPGGVGITLTPDQVSSVNSQSGALVISGGMTLQQLVDQVNSASGTVVINKGMTLEDLIRALDRAKKAPAPPCCGQGKAPPKPESAEPPKQDVQTAKDIAELRDAINEIMKALVKKKE